MSKSIRYFLALLAFAAWGACMAASMTANVKFGLMVAGKEWSPEVLGAATAASDVFKSITPIAGLYFLFRRWYWPAVASLLMLVVTVGYSTIAAIGFAAVTRAHYSDGRVGVAIQAKGTTADLDNLRKKRSFLPEARPVGAVENAIEAAKIERAWTASNGCKDVEKWSRAFCTRYLGLQSELASAKEWQAVNADIAAAEAKLENGGGYVSDPDPQAKQLAKLTGMDREAVTTGLVLLMAALLEVGSSFGLTLALALLRPEHGVVADALSVVMPSAKPAPPEDPRKVPAPAPTATVQKPDGPGTPVPAPAMPQEKPAADVVGQAPTFVGRGSSKVVVGIKPVGAEQVDPPHIVRRFSIKPPFVHTETVPSQARKTG